MGRELVTKIEINAPASRVWAVLADFSKYKEWNPFLVQIDGKLQEGEVLTVEFSNGFKISPKLVLVEPEKQFKWAGKLACGGLFDGQHRFVLTPGSDPSKTQLEQSEEFSGILIPLLPGLMRETEENFKKLNEALKKRCEEST